LARLHALRAPVSSPGMRKTCRAVAFVTGDRRKSPCVRLVAPYRDRAGRGASPGDLLRPALPADEAELAAGAVAVAAVGGEGGGAARAWPDGRDRRDARGREEEAGSGVQIEVRTLAGRRPRGGGDRAGARREGSLHLVANAVAARPDGWSQR